MYGFGCVGAVFGGAAARTWTSLRRSAGVYGFGCVGAVFGEMGHGRGRV